MTYLSRCSVGSALPFFSRPPDVCSQTRLDRTPAAPGTIPHNKDVVQTILNLKDFKSVSGEIHIDAEGNIRTKPKLAVIKDGKTVLVEEE